MKNKNLLLKIIGAVAGVLGVVFGFLVNFDFKTIIGSETEWTENGFGLLSKPDENLIKGYELTFDTTFKTAFKVIAAIVLFVCLAAVLVLIASLVLDLLNKKVSVMDKVANIAKYVLAGAVVVFVASLLIFVLSNHAVEGNMKVKLGMPNLVMFILSAVMLVGSAVCAFFTNRKAK